MYRVILLRNGEYKKTLHRCKTRETSFINFNIFLENNKKIIFPKKFINSNGIRNVEYKICLVKDTKEGDTFRIVRDRFGRTYEEKPFGDWTILKDSEYDVEESFWLYGKSPIHERVTIHDILKPLTLHAYKKNMSKQLIVVHNKLIIYNEDQFDMVICKCKSDAQRLHHALAKACKRNKIKSIVFMGTASDVNIPTMYKIIKENTDWPMSKIMRTSTRP